MTRVKKPISNLIFNFILMLLGTIFSVCALWFGYDLRGSELSLLICAAAVLIFAVLATLWRWKGFCVNVALTATFLAVFHQALLSGVKVLLYQITYQISLYFKIVPIFSDYSSKSGIELTLAAVGVILALLLSVTICLRSSALLTAAALSPILVLCLLAVELRPPLPLLAGIGALLLALVFRKALAGSRRELLGRMTLPALLLATLLLGGAYLIVPADGFVRPVMLDEFEQSLSTVVPYFREMAGTLDGDYQGGLWISNTKQVNVADAGDRVVVGETLLKVIPNTAGTIYLRGYSMGAFDGRQWQAAQASDQSNNVQGHPAALIQQYDFYSGQISQSRSLSIEPVADVTGLHYTPYYHALPFVDGADWFNDSYQRTSQNVYTVRYYEPSASFSEMKERMGASSVEWLTFLSPYEAGSLHQYLAIDLSTAQGLQALAAEAGIDSTADRAAVVAAVADYISNAGRYTLTPAEIPADADFALYLLTESKQGYCLHYATAATLMLRALDIPARFTSGFTIGVNNRQVNTEVLVTDAMAHAWVEVYYPDIGWLPLEVTPSYSRHGTVAAAPAATVSPEVTPSVAPNEEPSPSPTPGAENADNENAGAESTQRLLRVLWAICLLAVLILFLLVRRYLTLAMREKQFHQLNTNDSVVQIWCYVNRVLGKKGEYNPDMEALAEKARFSQHEITEEEHRQMLEYAETQAKRAYGRRAPLGKLWFSYGRNLL